MTLHSALTLAAALAAVALLPASAADLIEPWEAGLSNLELHLERSGSDDGASACAVAGFGIGSGVSLGVVAQRPSQRAAQPGVIAVWTTDLRTRGEVDLFLEAIRAEPTDGAGGWGGTAGLEWSAPDSPARPYVRVAADHEAGRWTPRLLLGVVVAAAPRLELHLESSAETDPAGGTTVELAVGPNLRLAARAELLTEVRWSRDGSSRGTGSLAVGIVLDPRSPS